MATTLGISLIYVVVQFVSLWAVMKAYELDLSIWAAVGIVTIIRLWTVVPNVPGNIGFLNAACVVALKGLDVEPKVATTFSIILLGVWTLPIVLLGALATALTGSNITELRRRARLRAGRGRSHFESALERRRGVFRSEQPNRETAGGPAHGRRRVSRGDGPVRNGE